MFYALLGSTTVLLEDSVSKRDPNWIFYSSGNYRGLTGRPNECIVLLQEGTTVLLEDSVSRKDPNWIFYSSGDYHVYNLRIMQRGTW